MLSCIIASDLVCHFAPSRAMAHVSFHMSCSLTEVILCCFSQRCKFSHMHYNSTIKMTLMCIAFSFVCIFSDELFSVWTGYSSSIRLVSSGCSFSASKVLLTLKGCSHLLLLVPFSVKPRKPEKSPSGLRRPFLWAVRPTNCSMDLTFSSWETISRDQEKQCPFT